MTYSGDACLTLFDTNLERKNEVGRTYPYEPLGLGVCLFHSKVLETHDLKEGDIAYLKVNPRNLYNTMVT